MSLATADATETTILAALRRLLSDPNCQRLYGTGRMPGLFPSSSAAARRIADQLVARGFIELADGSGECALTQRGRDWLLQKENTRLLLEDLLRATESQVETLNQMQTQLSALAAQLQQQRLDVTAVCDRLPRTEAAFEGTAIEYLRAREFTERVGDCSLGELFQHLAERQPSLTIGQFHDCLRRLHEGGKLRLAPWTGPLYQLPDPALALLIGHEVLYYVQLTRNIAA